MSKQLLLAFYGDDFTGSTDALEFLCRAGAKTLLFINEPTKDQLLQFPDLDAIGVAGKTRAMHPGEMEATLESAFTQLKDQHPLFVHYKVCSTFDSSATIGSIGKAIDIGVEVFNNTLTPIIGGVPALGRYCVFGNLFAKMGIGTNGQIYRLDRHPSMSKHPVTPATESDLRLHLGKQTVKSIGLIDTLQIEAPIQKWTEHITEKLVLLDTQNDAQLLAIGAWMQQLQEEDGILFSVGGSSVEMALGKYWNEHQILKPTEDFHALQKMDTLLVISGSCSPVTAAQIDWALANGFSELVIDAVALSRDGIIEEHLMENVLQLLKEHKKLLVHTGKKQGNHLPSEKLGTALGLIAKKAVEQIQIKRVVIAGGDTSSYAARAMEIDAVEMICPVVVGAPLCKAFSSNEFIDGLELNFKGGQVGAENYFGLF